MKVSIHQIGVSSPIGDSVQSAAAFRAGISRFRESRESFAFFPGDEEPVPVPVSALPEEFSGFSDIGRLILLVSRALEELFADRLQQPLDPATSFFVALPYPENRGIGFRVHNETEAQDLAVCVMQRALTQVGQPVPPRDRFRAFLGDHAASADALESAIAALESGACDHVVLCAVDTLVGPRAVEFLGIEGRLKTSDLPAGVIPGEAAAVLCIGRVGASSSGEAPPLASAKISMARRQVLSATEKAAGVGEAGAAMAACILEVEQRGHGDMTLICDHAGESLHAMLWGHTLNQLTNCNPEAAYDIDWMPATSFGEVGAACGALSLCMAIQRTRRERPGTGCFTVALVEDQQELAAISLSFDG